MTQLDHCLYLFQKTHDIVNKMLILNYIAKFKPRVQAIIVLLLLVLSLWQVRTTSNQAYADTQSQNALYRGDELQFSQHILALTLSGQIKAISQIEIQIKDSKLPVSVVEAEEGINKVKSAILEGQLAQAKINLAILKSAVTKLSSDYTSAKVAQDKQLAENTAAAKLAADKAARAATAVSLATDSHVGQIPILIYHLTPTDFDNQLTYLQSHGYTTLTPREVAVGLRNPATLPTKPVWLTFDDGFLNQLSAFTLLSKHHMKATFYIIDGGAGSGWHIGANRHLPDPQGGYDYLNWDQIRMLDQSGLITIGSHTIDHLGLALQNTDIQRDEIINGKLQLEQQLGHLVDSFAYPYGSYNLSAISLVAEAGFSTAVTTVQAKATASYGLLTLPRIRSVYALP